MPFWRKSASAGLVGSDPSGLSVCGGLACGEGTGQRCDGEIVGEWTGRCQKASGGEASLKGERDESLSLSLFFLYHGDTHGRARTRGYLTYATYRLLLRRKGSGISHR